MKLSILIPTHNRPKLFTRCINSILKQNPFDIEIIVNNDSNDIEEIFDSRVQYYYNKFDNLSKVYEFLLNASSGKFVYYLEDDDYLTDKFFEKLDFEADLIIGNYVPMYNTPHKVECMRLYKDERLDPIIAKKKINLEHLQLSQFIFKRDSIIDFSFPNDNNVHNDINLVMHSLSNVDNVRFMNKVLYHQTKDGGDNISFIDTVPSIPVTANMSFMSKYKRIIHLWKESEPPIFFDWKLTGYCNYNCEYCSEKGDLTNDINSAKFVEMYRLVLTRLQLIKDDFEICLTGGETSLHPHIVELVTRLSEIEHCQSISMFTNLSRASKFYNQFKNFRNLDLFASYHPEYSSEDFVMKCKQLIEEGVNLSVHVTLSDKNEYWDQTITVMEELKRSNVRFKPLILNPTMMYKPNYTDMFLNKFKHYLENDSHNFFKTVNVQYDDGSVEQLPDYEIELRKINRFKGYKCKVSSFLIDIDGVITNSCTRRKLPLNINLKELRKEEICPNDICPGRRLTPFEKTI